MKYKHLFFDLDHTLWDYESNAQDSLNELYAEHALDGLGAFSKDEFQGEFHKINHRLWKKYNNGELEKEGIRQQRFQKVLESLGVPDSVLAKKLSGDYLERCPSKSKLLPYAVDTLEYLCQRYTLSIITNGFIEVQYRKLKGSRIDHYFQSVTASDSANSRKPSKAIFDFAIEQVGGKPSEALMIGDNLEADVGGAINASIDAVYYNPQGHPHGEATTYEVTCLSKLTNLL